MRECDAAKGAFRDFDAANAPLASFPHSRAHAPKAPFRESDAAKGTFRDFDAANAPLTSFPHSRTHALLPHTSPEGALQGI
ncbi:hypothetical protein GCM10009754_81120 [Amycolatopsis minnesotensis]|uniref:Uncharacterized protein n=1 Tax=Amycolatopsis minnesotensis TaxID=337894 RepID=A0ABP5E402_9PSEU